MTTDTHAAAHPITETTLTELDPPSLLEAGGTTHFAPALTGGPRFPNPVVEALEVP